MVWDSLEYNRENRVKNGDLKGLFEDIGEQKTKKKKVSQKTTSQEPLRNQKELFFMNIAKQTHLDLIRERIKAKKIAKLQSTSYKRKKSFGKYIEGIKAKIEIMKQTFKTPKRGDFINFIEKQSQSPNHLSNFYVNK